MALIRVETNANIPEEKIRKLAKSLAVGLAPLVGEAEKDVRSEIAGNRRMRMAVDDEPLVHVELRNVEFPKDRARELTAAVVPPLVDHVGVQDRNVYIAVVSNRNSMWRVNGDIGQ